MKKGGWVRRQIEWVTHRCRNYWKRQCLYAVGLGDGAWIRYILDTGRLLDTGSVGYSDSWIR